MHGCIYYNQNTTDNTAKSYAQVVGSIHVAFFWE